jgi:hypothetical protein
MDQITTPNPKCRLYWCLIKFIDTDSHVGIFQGGEGIGLCRDNIKDLYTV